MTGNEILAEIADLCQEFTNSGAEQTRMLRWANAEQRILESQLSKLPGRHLLRSQTFSTVADRTPNRYSKPSDYQKAAFMEYVIADSTADYERLFPVQHISEKGISYLDDDDYPVLISTNSQGKPQAYLVGGDFVQLFPISDAIYTIRIWYHKRFAAITASDTELDTPEDFADPIIEGCRYRLYKRLRQDTRDMLAELMTVREIALNSVSEQVVDGPRYMSTDIPVEDWA